MKKTIIKGYSRQDEERTTVTQFDNKDGLSASYRVLKTEDGTYTIEMREENDRWQVVDTGDCLASEDAGFILLQYLER
jgi:hypothetical protein